MVEKEKPLINFGEREYESDCFIVAVDNVWFAARHDDDWADHPAYAQKYGKLRMANARAAEEQAMHTNRKVRVVKLRQRFLVQEIEP